MTQIIHTTIGVYPDGSTKINGVLDENLESHIDYNLVMRPGRALFVDGKCVHEGFVAKGILKTIETDLKNKPIVMTKDTAPYV